MTPFLPILIVATLWVTAFAFLIPEPYASILYVKCTMFSYKVAYGSKWRDAIEDRVMEFQMSQR